MHLNTSEWSKTFTFQGPCRWFTVRAVLTSCQEYFLLLLYKTVSPCPIHHTEQLISCLFTTAFISGHTAHPKDKAWEQNTGPNSDLSHLLKHHNYYLTQALLFRVESLPPSDHCVRVTTFDSVFYIILFWLSLFFSNKTFFFLFKQCLSSATVSCFTILHNCLCKERSIKPTLLQQIFLPILHGSYSRSQRISSPPHFD